MGCLKLSYYPINFEVNKNYFKNCLTSNKSVLDTHKQYEQSNHLGNVLVTLSDRKFPVKVDGYWEYYDPNVLSYSDYYPFGSLMPNRHSGSTAEYRFGFNGKESDDEIKGVKNSYDFGARIYDPRIGRFLSIDPIFKDYPFMSPYVFAGNDPIRFEDVYGMGPGDRVKKSKSFVGTPYVQETTSSLRTGTDDAALANLDCSELVCRVLADDGLTPQIKHLNTAGLLNFLSNTEKFHKSDQPKVGDVFLWRTESGGHTGIVTGINEDGTIQITHAANTKRGTVTDDNLSLSYFTNQTGWKGFFRPLEEEKGKNPFTKLSNNDLLAKSSNLTNRIGIIENFSSIRAAIQEAKGNTDRADEIRANAKSKVDRLQGQLNSVNEEIGNRGINTEE